MHSTVCLFDLHTVVVCRCYAPCRNVPKTLEVSVSKDLKRAAFLLFVTFVLRRAKCVPKNCFSAPMMHLCLSHSTDGGKGLLTPKTIF